MTDENWKKHENAKKQAKAKSMEKAHEYSMWMDQCEKAGLSYRYFRNNNPLNKTNRNHEGVISIGYKIISESKQGIKVSFSVAFCSPKDSFSREHARKLLVKRYLDGHIVTVHIDLGSSKMIDSLIRDIWNGGKIPLEKLGIRNVIEGKPVKLKSWMKIIR